MYDIYDVNSILKEVALKAKTNIENLEINLKSFKTYIKKYDAFRLINISENENIDDDLLFENKKYEFKQSYDFSVRHKPQNRLFDVIINEDSIVLHLKSGFIPPKNDVEINEFINVIDSIKVQNGVFLRHLGAQKEIIVNHLSNIIKDDIFITIYQCSQFVSRKGGIFEVLIQDFDSLKNNIMALKENTKIAKFTKQKDGKSGRNVFGKYINILDYKVELPQFSNDFRINDSDDCFEYFNIKSGFVLQNQNNFSFENELSLKNIKNRDNYNFIGDVDTDTKIIIGTDNEFDDAIGSGIKIIANNIFVNGNIGESVRIVANKLEVNGQIHKDSTIITKEAKIDVHKGNISGDNIFIRNIESGIVECNNLESMIVNGGTLVSKNIEINELYYNSHIEFSSKCTINNLKGGNNKIIFTPFGNVVAKKQIQSMMTELDSIIAKQSVLQKKISSLIYKYNQFHSTAKELKEMIEKSKEQNKEIPRYVAENYDYFLKIVEFIKSLKMKNLNLEKLKMKYSQKIKDLQNEVFDAELICKDGWLKYNDIVFELIEPKAYSSKAVIKGIGRYYFDYESKKIIHQKIFVDTNEEINNYGF